MKLLQPGQNSWVNGLKLAGLNIALIAFSAFSFLGVLTGISWLNQLRYASDGNAAELPFPYWALFLLYAIIFPAAWVWFGRSLQEMGRKRMGVSLWGASPFFLLSVLGYAGVGGTLVFNEANPGFLPVASFFVFGGIATLILLAGITCMGLISLVGGSGKEMDLAAPISS